MKRISVTGWVPIEESETVTLEECELEPTEIRARMQAVLEKKKADALKRYAVSVGTPSGVKRVRVTVEIDVEVLS